MAIHFGGKRDLVETLTAAETLQIKIDGRAAQAREDNDVAPSCMLGDVVGGVAVGLSGWQAMKIIACLNVTHSGPNQ